MKLLWLLTLLFTTVNCGKEVLRVNFDNKFQTRFFKKENKTCEPDVKFDNAKTFDLKFKIGSETQKFAQVEVLIGQGGTSDMKAAYPDKILNVLYTKVGKKEAYIVRTRSEIQAQFHIENTYYAILYGYFDKNYMIVREVDEIYAVSYHRALKIQHRSQPNEFDKCFVETSHSDCPKVNLIKQLEDKTALFQSIIKTCVAFKKHDDPLDVCFYQNNQLFISDLPIAAVTDDQIVVMDSNGQKPEFSILDASICSNIKFETLTRDDIKFTLPLWEFPKWAASPTTTELPWCHLTTTPEYNGTNSSYWWLDFGYGWVPFALFGTALIVLTSFGVGTYCKNKDIENKLVVERDQENKGYEHKMIQKEEQIKRKHQNLEKWKRTYQVISEKCEKRKVNGNGQG